MLAVATGATLAVRGAPTCAYMLPRHARSSCDWSSSEGGKSVTDQRPRLFISRPRLFIRVGSRKEKKKVPETSSHAAFHGSHPREIRRRGARRRRTHRLIRGWMMTRRQRKRLRRGVRVSAGACQVLIGSGAPRCDRQSRFSGVSTREWQQPANELADLIRATGNMAPLFATGLPRDFSA